MVCKNNHFIEISNHSGSIIFTYELSYFFSGFTNIPDKGRNKAISEMCPGTCEILLKEDHCYYNKYSSFHRYLKRQLQKAGCRNNYRHYSYRADGCKEIPHGFKNDIYRLSEEISFMII